MLLSGAADDASAGGPLTFAGDVASADSPSWLTRHPRFDVVYAALEEAGAVQAFRRTGEAKYAPLGSARRGGQRGVPHRRRTRRRLSDRELLVGRARREDAAGCRGPAVVPGHRRRGNGPVRAGPVAVGGR